MRFRIDYEKEGSEEFIDRLAAYIENWRIRKMNEKRSAVKIQVRKRVTHKLVISDMGETLYVNNESAEKTDLSQPVSSAQKRKTNRFFAAKEETGPAEISSAPREKMPASRNMRQQHKNKAADIGKKLALEASEAAESDSETKKTVEAAPLGRKATVKKVLSRIGISILTFVIILLVFAFTADMIVLHGPSKSARDRFVLTVTETSAAKFLATWFLSDETVESIIKGNAVIDSGKTTDTTLIKLPGTEDNSQNESSGGTSETPVDMNSVQLIDIKGKTYQGKLLIVQNPKRVFIGTPDAYGSDKEGVTTLNMVKNANALYGINGGGFYDTGSGNGGIPTGRENSDGLVISHGKIMWGELGQSYEIIGINKQGILVLGKMTGQEALDRGIVEALNFGPYLVVNGEACEVGGFSEAGLNPRSAIGQRSDGAMLLLTIDGRQPSSMGATYEDIIEIMMNYGAVNAANLDGGSSTYMAQNAETENNPKIITQCASLYGPRRMATSILVSRAEQVNDQYE